ncbi:methyltransferase domain-containing protein [Anabaena azotica FACHB-119]|uniref:Methyltransferase domain-containing protein n=1 Tax=Anabaena azotica FACHB-119 TaxID=947527 RepID=A0ABR8D7V9_9NOST|nr:methyltransferase domain-containing protein [Anabaena azotica FACHB-119]
MHQFYSEAAQKINSVRNQIFYKQVDLSLNGKTLLDIGCGDGTDAAYFASQGAIVTGIDPCENFITSAKEKTPDGQFIIATGENLPFADQSFDIVVSKYVLQISPNLSGTLEEIARVIKVGGILLYLVVHPFRQFIENRRTGKNYFQSELIDFTIYGGLMTVKEPSHTFSEYFNQHFLNCFQLLAFEEGFDFKSAEQIGEDIYPTFFLLKAVRKND